MPATMRDVARLAGVSVKTVSNVVNNTYPYIRPETRAAVEAAMAALDYRLNVTARKLRTNRTGLIGLALPELRSPYFAELADEVIGQAAAAGLKVIIEQVQASDHVAVDDLLGNRIHLIDGAIVAPGGSADVPAHSVPSGFPLVVLGDHRFGDPVDQIFMANAEGAALAVQHLLERGARRVVALGSGMNKSTGNVADRTRGYRTALAAHGVDADPALIRSAPGWSKAAGAEAVRTMLDEQLQFDAVFAYSDTLALGAITALAERGIAVPERVQVVGFDDIDDARYAVPSLTTVRVDRGDVASIAVHMLTARLDGDGGDAPTVVEMPATIVVRRSTRAGVRPFAASNPSR